MVHEKLVHGTPTAVHAIPFHYITQVTEKKKPVYPAEVLFITMLVFHHYSANNTVQYKEFSVKNKIYTSKGAFFFSVAVIFNFLWIRKDGE